MERREFLSVSGSAAMGLAATGLATKASGSSSTTKPNVIIIFTDDQGYQDLGCFGSPNIKTPNIDAMAEEGLKFTSFYVASSVCTPSRISLLTGRYAARTGWTSGVVWPGNNKGMSLEETTIGEMFKSRGYATACIGKWHVGHTTDYLPTSRGFDYYYGIPYSNDMDPVILMQNEETIEDPVDQTTITKRYTTEALQFIEDNKENPFFIYLPHTMPHVPLHASDDFLGASERGLYGDTVEEIDWSTGRIVEKIKSLGLEENTLIIFTSDNGPWLSKEEDGGSADPFRGGKMSTREGGQRVPCVMWWPGTIPSGTTCDEIATAMDFFPTIANLLSADLPSKPLDGRDIYSLMTNPETATTPHSAFLYYGGGGDSPQSIRAGKWKVYKDKLYNLEEDIEERKDLSETEPSVYQDLVQLRDLLAEAVLNDQPFPGETGVPPSVSRALKNRTVLDRRDAFNPLGRKLTPEKNPARKTGQDAVRRLGTIRRKE